MIRKIEVNVDRAGKIESTNGTFSGVCGETGATTVIFNVSNELLSAIREEIADNTLYYRFEVTDALNKHFVLENKVANEENSFCLPITNAFTMSDGKITVMLVFESENLTLCTLPLDLVIEKGCDGNPDKVQVYNTMVTVLEQANNTANEILNQATQKADTIKSETINTANGVLEEINSVSENGIATMQELVEENENTLDECEQRKNAAETAAVNAINAANDAANSKAQAEALLTSKEDVTNKETNLMQDVLPDHTKYASAKATQELVNAMVSYFSDEMRNADARLEGLKADRTELEETTALLAETQQELVSAKAEIERLKTAEDFQLIGRIICDGKTKNHYLRNIEPLKKIYISINTQNPLSENLGSFSCYVNTFSGSGSALAVTQANINTKYFRLYSERIAKGIWKTDTSQFCSTVYGHSWNTSYVLTDVDYITSLRVSCGEEEKLFLPEGTSITVYGVKS